MEMIDFIGIFHVVALVRVSEAQLLGLEFFPRAVHRGWHTPRMSLHYSVPRHERFELIGRNFYACEFGVGLAKVCALGSEVSVGECKTSQKRERNKQQLKRTDQRCEKKRKEKKPLMK
jgi:hypothetical protein